MPLPADLVTVTVTATYEAIDGSLAAGGTVTFDAGGIITDNAGRFILGEPATATVVNGQIAVTLPATDNTDLRPTDFTYTVTEEIAGWAPRTYQVALPSSFAPGIDLSQLVPVTAPSQPPDPSLQAAGDLSGPWADPVVTSTHLTYPMPVEQGGTGQATALTYTDVGADAAGAAADALTQAQEYTDAETAQLASQIGAATGLAVTAGDTAPPNPTLNDLWINESAGNVLEQFDGTDWVPYQFGLAALAPDVTSQLGGGSTVTMGPAIPSSATAGDLWIQTSPATGVIVAILQCTTAYDSGGTRAANWAVESATSARALGAPYTYQQSATPNTANNPSNPPQPGDLWINESAGNVLEQMTGGTSASPAWTQFQIGLAALGSDAVAAINSKAKASLGSSVPPSAAVGDLWIQVNSAGTSITGIYTCTTAYTSGGTQAANWSTETLSARALGAPFAYQQASAPSTSANPSNPPQLNDLWINTSAGNVINQMTGGTASSPVWTQFALGSGAIANGAVGLAQLGTDATAAINAKSKANLGPAVPASAAVGDVWIQVNASGTSVTGIFVCTTAYTSGGTTAKWSAETLNARALGAPYTYQQSATPNTANNAGNPPQVNDLWINTASGNVINQMTGGTAANPVWTQFALGSAAIASGAVGNTQLATGAVSAANQTAAFSGLNMIPDPQFSNSALTSQRLADPGAVGTWSVASGAVTGTAAAPRSKFWLTPSYSSPKFPGIWVNPGEQYYLSVNVTVSGLTSGESVQPCIALVDQAQTELRVIGTYTANGTYTLSGTITVPAASQSAGIELFAYSTTPGITVKFSAPVCQPATLYSPTIIGGTITGAQVVATNSQGEFLGYKASAPGAGTMYVSVSPTSGTDPYGNQYTDGVATYGPGNGVAYLAANQTTGVPFVVLQPPGASYIFTRPQVYGQAINAGLVNEYCELDLISGDTTSHTSHGSINITSGSNDGTIAPTIHLQAPRIYGYGGAVTLGDNLVSPNVQSPNSGMYGQSVFTQYATANYTVNATSSSQFCQGFTIPANDAKPGTVYELEMPFFGTWGSGFPIYWYLWDGVTSASNWAQCFVGAAFFTSGTSFNGFIKFGLMILSTGTSGTANAWAMGGIGIAPSAGNRSSGSNNNNGALTGLTGNIGLNTTVSRVLTVQCGNLAGSGTFPTITSYGAKLTRSGP